jgi:hypothetical protein
MGARDPEEWTLGVISLTNHSACIINALAVDGASDIEATAHW